MEQVDDPTQAAGAGTAAIIGGPIPDRALRSALEFAVDIAAAGVKLRPPLPFPVGLKPFLRLQRLPPSAMARVRRAVEDDAVFLERLGSVASPELVDDIGMLWLARPQGWRSAVDQRLAAAVEPLATLDATGRREQRRREAAEHAAERARMALAAAEVEASSMRSARDEQRAKNKVLADELALMERRVSEVAATMARLDAELARTRSELAAAEARTAAADARGESAERARDSALAARAAAVAPNGPPHGDPAFPDAGHRDPGHAEAVQRLAQRAVRGANEVERLVSELAALVDVRSVAPALPVPFPAPARPLRKRIPMPRRTPLPIPGGLYGHSAAVTEHLLRAPGVVVIVDGYNVVKLGWPALDLARQREVGIDAAEDIARRWGTAITVVFDGADVPGASAPRRRLVRVMFSPGGVIADDVVRAEVGAVDVNTPVVVVSNDQALLADIRSAGANSVSSDQFLAIARR